MRLTRKIALITCVVFCGLLGAGNFAVIFAATGKLTRKRAIEEVMQRLSQLQNVTASFKMTRRDIITPQIIALDKKITPWLHKVYPTAHFGKNMPQTCSYHCNFRFLYGRVYYARYILDPAKNASRDLPLAQVQAITGGRSEYLGFPAKAYSALVRTTGSIQTHEAPLDSLLISSALGLRPIAHHHWRWLDAATVKRMEFTDQHDGDFSLTQVLRGGVRYRWSFMRAPSIKLVGIRESMTSPGGRNAILTTVRLSNFHRVDGLLLPERAVETQFSGRRFLAGPLRRIVLTHIRYEIEPRVNVRKSYFIVFPRGSVIIDQQTGSVFHIIKPTILSDKEIFTRLKKRDTAGAR